MEKKEEAKSFEANFRMLEKLAQELQENRISIDELVPRIQQALAAIKICKDVLQQTKSKLTQLSTEFEGLSEKTEAAEK